MYVPTGTHTALRLRETDGKEDTFVEKATAIFTKHALKHRVSTPSELKALKIVEVGEDTDVEGLCHFAAIVPKDGNSRPFPVHLAYLLLYRCKTRVHVCSWLIPSSNVPPTTAVTSLQLHCCPLLLNPNGFGLACKSFSSAFHCQDKEAERLYVAELARYTSNWMARKAARQKAEAAAVAAR